jgi:integrase
LETLGKYPDVSLAEARKKAKERMGQVVWEMESPQPSIGFTEARDRFLADAKLRTKLTTYTEYKRLLEKHFVFTKQLRDLSRQDIMGAVEALKQSPSTAAHAFMAIKVFMNWALSRGLIENSPMPRLRFPAPSRTRTLTNEELCAVWLHADEEGYPYGTMVKLLVLTGQRRGEISGLRRSWIEGDTITYPVGFTKNKREHRVPLCPFAKEILASVPDNGTDLLFPARGKPEQCFNGWGKAKHHFDKGLSLAPFTLHDLRRTFSSKMAELGTPIHVTEKLLNHVSGSLGGVAGIYNRYTYLPEMRQAVEAYEAHLKALLEREI